MTESELAEAVGSTFEHMSVYEAIDLQLQRVALVYSSEEQLLIAITIYLTLVSAFLAAAYVGGSSLNRAQTLIGSAIFTVASSYLTLTITWILMGINFQRWAIGLQYQQMAEQYGRPDWVEFGQSFQLDGRLAWGDYVIIGLLIGGNGIGIGSPEGRILIGRRGKDNSNVLAPSSLGKVLERIIDDVDADRLCL